MSDAIRSTYKPGEDIVFTFDRGIAQAYVPDHGDPIHIVVDQIQSERSREVIAQVKVRGGTEEPAELIHRTRLNLTSARSRQETAKYLSQRVPNVDWSVLLEWVSWRVVDAHHQGKPAMLLRDAEEPAGGSLLLAPLLPATDPAILFGDGGAAKSYLGLALALSIHTGRAIVANLKPTAPRRVAYLDFEWSPWPHKKRMRALWGDSDDAELPDLEYVPCAGTPLSQQVDRLRSLFQEHGIEYAVLDSVALACDGPPEEAQVAVGFFQALARLEVGSCLVAHINRTGDTMKPFGSVYWHNSARMTWYVQGVQEPGGSELHVGLYNRKSNEDGLRPPLGLRFAFGEQTVITHADLRRIPELASGLTVKARMQGELAAGALPISEVATRLEVPPNTIRVTANRHPKIFRLMNNQVGLLSQV